MKGSPCNRIPTISINNSFTTDHSEISNGLASYFHTKSTQLPHTTPININDFNTNQSLPYNSPFSFQELQEALNNMKRSAPGPDNIHLDMIKHLIYGMLLSLLTFYNHIWLQAEFPSSWLLSTIIPIHKPGKPRTSLSSYRPISLTNHLCKLLERMVLARLTWIIETKELLSPLQYGFRKHRSAMDHLASLETDIRRSFSNNNHTLLISLDLSSAFDITNKNIIIAQLFSAGLRGALPKFLINFLQSRTFRVKANGIFSIPFTTSLGVPQGSVLSPTLFNIALSTLSEHIAPNIKCKIFADDILMYTSSPSSSDCTRLLQRSVNSLSTWATKHGYIFSPHKSSSVHFCKKKCCPRMNPLTIANISIPSADQLKILGLIFDYRLTWKPHIQSLKTKSFSDINLIRMLSGATWGADFHSLSHLYKSLILSRINYGNFIYDSASPHVKKPLETIQNCCLRLATGAFRTTPITSLQCIASTQSLQLSRQLSLLKFYSTSLHRPHTRSSLNLVNVHRPNITFPTDSIPHRINKLLIQHNISPPHYNYPLQTTFPPWLSPLPNIDLTLHSYKKSEHSNIFFNKLFLDRLSNIYPNHLLFFTDGSKTEKGVGAAFFFDNIVQMFKLPKHISIFSAELLAIKEAIRYSLQANIQQPTLIISDSLSALKAINSRNLNFNYIRQILDLMYTATLKKRTISLLWLPSHIGNPHNDRADYLAKLAIERGSMNMGENHYSDFNIFIKHLHSSLFQLKWDLEDPNNKLWSIKTNVFPPLNSTELNRRHNVIMRRLALGHTYSTHVHLLKRDPPPLCPKCDSPLSVLHLIESIQHQNLRDTHGIPSNITILIKSFVPLKENITNYLKEFNFIV